MSVILQFNVWFGKTYRTLLSQNEETVCLLKIYDWTVLTFRNIPKLRNLYSSHINWSKKIQISHNHWKYEYQSIIYYFKENARKSLKYIYILIHISYISSNFYYSKKALQFIWNFLTSIRRKLK